MQILDYLLRTGENIWYSEKFMVAIQSHMPTLMKDYTVKLLAVDSFKAYKYEGNLFEFLTDVGVDRYFHYPIMLANNFTSPSEFGPGISILKIPDLAELERIKELYLSQ